MKSVTINTASHIVVGPQDIRNTDIISVVGSWVLANTTSSFKWFDFRLRLRRRRTLVADHTWVEYVPSLGLVNDFSQNISTEGIVYLDPALVLPNGRTQIAPGVSIQSAPGSTTLFSGVIGLPGPNLSQGLSNFWADQNGAGFNFLLEIYHQPVSGAHPADSIQLGSHEFTNLFSVQSI